MTTSSKTLIEQMKWRYAVKLFDSAKKLSEDQWSALQQSLVLTPSSYGLQPWKFLVIEDKTLRAKLRAVSWNQAQVEDCSHFVVFTALHRIDGKYIDRYVAKTGEIRNVAVDKLQGFRQMMMKNVVEGAQKPVIFEWATRQVYIALGNLMTSAALLGIDTCPMEGLDAQKYDEILGLDEYRTSVACAVGFRSTEDKYAAAAKVRFNAEDVVEFR